MGIVFICLGFVPILIGAVLYAATKEIAVMAITTGMGLIFIVLGIVFVILKNKKKKRIARFLSEGQGIDTLVYDIKINYGVKINRQTPYTIYSRYTDELTGNEYKFVSRYVTTKRKSKNGLTIGYTSKVEVGDLTKVYVINNRYDDYMFEVNM